MTINDNGNVNSFTRVGRANANDTLFTFNRILFLLKKNWYLFLISIPICVGSVYVYHRYTVPVYQAKATLLLKSGEKRSISQSDLIEGIGLSPEVRSVENQTFIIRSKKLVLKTIDRLDFGVSYFAKGTFKDTELYYNKPFIVEFDSLHPQLLNTPFQVQAITDDQLLISMHSEGGNLHVFKGKERAGRVAEVSLEKNVKFGEWVTQDEFSFRIIRTNSHMSKDMAYDFMFKSHNQLANEFRRKLGVSSYREGSSIIFVTATGTSPSKIQRFLDQLCEVILEHNLDQKNHMATRSLAFIQAQLENISDTLENVQNKLLDYRKTNRFMGPSEFSQKLAEQYFETEKEIKLIEMQESYYRYLQKNLEGATEIEEFMLPAVDDESTSFINQLVLQLIAYQEEREMMLSAAQRDNHYLKALDSKVVVTRDNLKKAVNQVLKSLSLEKQKYERHISQIVLDMNELPDLERTYLKIDRSYKLNDAIYTFLLQKHSETQIAKASNVPDNEIIDNASISAIVSPNKKGNYQKGIMLALLIPAAFIALKEFLNTKVRSKEDLNAYAAGVPIIGTVVHSNSDNSDVIHEHPHSIISESFRAVRTKLKFMSKDSEAKVITLTSTNTGEGKTFCAQNLASVFSISGKKTVLLGFDLRKPRLTALFDLLNNPGLSNYLIGENSIDEIIYSTKYDNLSIVPAGPIPPNPSELIANLESSDLFEYLRSRFDVIIVDSPPIGLVADARMLMQESDYNLFVVRANYTLKEHMALTLENLVGEDVNRLGVVLNDVSLKEKGYGYYSTEYYSAGSAFDG